MTTPENISHGGPEKATFWKKIKELLSQILHKKTLEEWEKKAKKAEGKRKEAETKKAWRTEEQRRQKRDEAREYHKRRSGEETVERVESARQLRIAEIQRHFQQFLEDHGRESSGYLYEIVRDGNIQRNINELIAGSPTVANLIDQLVTKEKEFHGDPRALLNLGRSLLYEADKAGGRLAITPLVEAVKRRTSDLILETIEFHQDELRIKKISPSDWLSDFLNTDLTDEQKRRLDSSSKAQRNERLSEIERVLTTNLDNYVASARARAEQPEVRHAAEWVERADQEVSAEAAEPPAKLVQAVDGIWQKVRQAEESGAPLSVDDLERIDRDLLEAESTGFPKDVISGTQAWWKAVEGSRRFVQDRRSELIKQLQERIKFEKPPIRRGIKSPKEFLKEMARKPGHLGYLLADNPEMEKLLVSYGPEGRRFRDQVFLTIHKKVLTDNYHSSRENFGLYEGADFDSFLKIARAGMAELIRPETGVSYGQSWEEWYVNLSNTVQLSRDIDFWASQPGASIEDMSKSLALFQNANSVQALTMPAVELAYRAYEDSLQSIRDSNDGYIPPALVGYDPAHLISYWDERSKQMLVKWMKMGIVKDAHRDEFDFHTVEKDGNTVRIGIALSYDKLHEADPQDLELSMYMTLGKGFGLASLRYLEMFANSKVPGSEQPGFAARGFHSGPYEGPARSLNWFADMIHKWRFGSYKFMHLMNTLLPEEHRIRHITETTPKEVYKAFRDGTAKAKYNEHVKRLYDLVNFSGVSSAFGPPYTTWRHIDSTFGWSDKKRELLGGPTLIMFSRRFAKERVKELLVTNRFKQEFRKEMARLGQPKSGEQFERLWESRGLTPDIEREIEEEWEKLHKKHKAETDHIIKQYQRAFIARNWVQMAMRNPLTVAHNMEIEVPDELFPEKKRTIRLHSFLAQQILGIPLEDTKYGEVAGKVAWDSSPTERQRQYMEEIMDLEADLAAVRERAVITEAEDSERAGYYRELTERDFDEVIKDPARLKQAKQYWYTVRKILLGSLEENAHQHLYEELGLALAENGEDYAVDLDKIKKVDSLLNKMGSGKVALDSDGRVTSRVMLNMDWIDKDWDLIIGTDDTAYRRMNILNLGPRQWARRGGDAVAHYAGGTKAGEYMRDLTGNPDVGDLAKMLRDVRLAYEGDMIEAGWQTVGLLAHGTSRLFALDYTRFGSVAQIDCWGTRRNIAAWTANGRRKFFDALEHLDVLPPLPDEETLEKSLYSIQGPYRIPHDIHTLRKVNRADNIDVWTEIITLGLLLALAITIWRALTAPSEEEEGGGGGRGGHH